MFLGVPVALLAVIVAYIWQDLGYNLVIFIAALQGIPETILDAARIDGAGGWQLFRYITLPLLKPTILLAGYSAYPRKINFAKMRELADEVGAVFMVDMAHFAGLVAGKVFTGDYNPVPHAHVVTSTTHKTLRGPRGGIILCKKEFAEFVDKGCPAILGGPLAHAMAAKAVAFREALAPEFQSYAQKIVENASELAAACQREGMTVLTGGTDNHLLLVDVANGSSILSTSARTSGARPKRSPRPWTGWCSIPRTRRLCAAPPSSWRTMRRTSAVSATRYALSNVVR